MSSREYYAHTVRQQRIRRDVLSRLSYRGGNSPVLYATPEDVHAAIERHKSVPVGVWRVAPGQFVTANERSHRFDMAMTWYGHALVGVYTRKTTCDELAADMALAEREAA